MRELINEAKKMMDPHSILLITAPETPAEAINMLGKLTLASEIGYPVTDHYFDLLKLLLDDATPEAKRMLAEDLADPLTPTTFEQYCTAIGLHAFQVATFNELLLDAVKTSFAESEWDVLCDSKPSHYVDACIVLGCMRVLPILGYGDFDPKVYAETLEIVKAPKFKAVPALPEPGMPLVVLLYNLGLLQRWV